MASGKSRGTSEGAGEGAKVLSAFFVVRFSPPRGCWQRLLFPCLQYHRHHSIVGLTDALRHSKLGVDCIAKRVGCLFRIAEMRIANDGSDRRGVDRYVWDARGTATALFSWQSCVVQR